MVLIQTKIPASTQAMCTPLKVLPLQECYMATQVDKLAHVWLKATAF